MVSVPLGRPGGVCHQDPPAAWQLKLHRSHNGSPSSHGLCQPGPAGGSLHPTGYSGLSRGGKGTPLCLIMLCLEPQEEDRPPTRPASSLFPFHTQALSADSGTKASSFTSSFPPRLAAAPQGRYCTPGCQSSETEQAGSMWGGSGETGPELLGLPTCYLSQTHTQSVASHLTEMKSS